MADQQLGRDSKILVVDGSAASRNVTHQYLRKLGYKRLEYSADNQTALRSIEQNKYQLVLADWDVATADGLDLLSRTRDDPRFRYLPFLMAIPQWQKKFIEIVRKDGATLYLTRPFTDVILQARLNQVHTDASRLKTVAVQEQTRKAMMSQSNSSNTELWKILRPD